MAIQDILALSRNEPYITSAPLITAMLPVNEPPQLHTFQRVHFVARIQIREASLQGDEHSQVIKGWSKRHGMNPAPFAPSRIGTSHADYIL